MQPYKSARYDFKFYGVVLLGALLLLIPACWNKYPLLNSDDGTYMHSGFLLFQPDDRPYMYGLALRAGSVNGFSLWAAVAIQAYLVSWLLVGVIKKIAKTRYFYTIATGILAILSLFTSLSWITSELIPDICTPVALLSMFLILAGGKTKVDLLILYFIYAFAVATHLSHFLIFLLILASALLFLKMLFAPGRRKAALRHIAAMTGCTILAFTTMLHPYNKSKHVFMMAAMLDQGILKKYLDEHCTAQDYRLCNYKDSLNPDPNYFLWDNNSPLYKEGGWDSVKPEYDRIIRGTLTEPKYIGLHIQASLDNSAKQLCSFGIGDGNFPFPENSHLHAAIKDHIPNDESRYLHARQHQGDIIPFLTGPNKIIYAMVIACFIGSVILIIVQRKQLSASAKLFLFLSVLLIAINTWDCATFAQVNGRYGCRVMWLVPFCLMLLIAQTRRHTENAIRN